MRKKGGDIRIKGSVGEPRKFVWVGKMGGSERVSLVADV